MMVVIVCGSRTWTDPEPIRMELVKLPADTMVLHGDAQGADKLAAEIALGLGFKVKAVPARWEDLGAAAGVLRNQTMLDMGPDLVLAFCNNPNPRSGTVDMAKRARAKGVRTKVVFQ